MKQPLQLLALLVLAAAARLPAKGADLKPCPAEFPLDALKIAAPAGWIGVGPQRLLLTGADVVVLHPDNGALVGNRRNTRTGYEVEYTEISTGLPAGSGIWLACRYGSIALAQRLPDNTDRCVVSYKPDEFGGHAIAVACQAVK